MSTIKLSDVTFHSLSNYEREDQLRDLSRRCGLEWPNVVNVWHRTHVTHSGLLDYLQLAWRNHHSVTIRPDDIWYVILCELAAVIAKKPQDYAKLFTTTPDKKQWIIVRSDDVTKIDPALVIETLRRCVPTDVDLFLPEFSTTTPDVRLARYIAFCDLCSPYYNYGTKLCGFPSIRFEGIDRDWDKLLTALGHMASTVFLQHKDTHHYLMRAHKCAQAMVNAVAQENATYLNKMLTLKKCGSGSEYEMSGWILDLLFNSKQNARLEGLPPHISKMQYVNMETKRKFILFTGLTESELQGDMLVPRYGQYVIEVTDEGKPKILQPMDPSKVELRLVSTPVVARTRVYYPPPMPK